MNTTTTNKAFSAHFRCDHCSLDLTGHEPYIQHLSGKRHLKKLREAGISSIADQPAVNANAASGYGGKFVTANNSNGATTGTEVPLTGTGQFNQQPNTGSRWDAPPPGRDPVAAAIRNNLLGRLPTKKAMFSGRCDVCNVDYTSKSQEDMHLTGKKHKKKTGISDGSHPMNSMEFYCKYCKMQLNSLQQMEQHTSGQSHKKKEELAKKLELGEGPTQAKRKFQPAVQTPTTQPGEGPTQAKRQFQAAEPTPTSLPTGPIQVKTLEQVNPAPPTSQPATAQ